jgi:hypothetical protein
MFFFSMPVNWKYIFTDLLTYLSNADHNRYRSICTSCAEPHHFYAASATVPGKHFDTSPALDQQKGNLKKKKIGAGINTRVRAIFSDFF